VRGIVREIHTKRCVRVIVMTDWYTAAKEERISVSNAYVRGIVRDIYTKRCVPVIEMTDWYTTAKHGRLCNSYKYHVSYQYHELFHSRTISRGTQR